MKDIVNLIAMTDPHQGTTMRGREDMIVATVTDMEEGAVEVTMPAPPAGGLLLLAPLHLGVTTELTSSLTTYIT